MRYKCQLYRRIVIRSFEVCCFYCSTVFPTLEWYRHACRWLIVDLQPKPALYVVKLEGGGHEWWHKWAKVHWVIRAGFNFLLPFLPFIWFILFTSLPWAYFCTLVCFHGLQPWRTFTCLTQPHTLTCILFPFFTSVQCAQVGDWQSAKTIYEFSAKDIDGNEVSLDKYR